MISVQIAQPVPKGLQSRAGYRLYCVLIAVDVLVSSLTGGAAYKTISSRIGERMADPQSRLANWTWPAWWRRHCLQSVYQAWV